MRALGWRTAAVLAGVLLLGSSGCVQTQSPPPVPSASREATPLASGDAAFARAFADRASAEELEGRGTVSKLLADDDEGARHQRFIVTLDSGQTLLVAHNIDIASRVSPLAVGDPVSFKGEYAWNAQGGVIHWTHHDPSGRHTPGWIAARGRTFQ
jgi:hypothetical protein